MTVEATTKDKQITIDVPEDRLAEFYAFYGHFLAGFPGRRRRSGDGPRGRHGHGHAHRCGRRHESTQATPAETPAPAEQAGSGPETTVV